MGGLVDWAKSVPSCATSYIPARPQFLVSPDFLIPRMCDCALSHQERALMLNRAPDRSPRGPHRPTRQPAVGCLAVSLIVGILTAFVAGGLATPASARGMSGASGGGHGSAGIGHPVARGSGAHVRSRSSTHAHREHLFADNDFSRFHDFRRFHHRHGDEFANGVFPWGFGLFDEDWPGARSDLADVASRDETDGRSWPFRGRVEHYEPPTVEVTPSGVTIMRGPGSHHF